MASVAAARRTQSAFPRILAASNASDLDVDPGPYSAGRGRARSRICPGCGRPNRMSPSTACVPCVRVRRSADVLQPAGGAGRLARRPLLRTRTVSSSPVAGAPTPAARRDCRQRADGPPLRPSRRPVVHLNLYSGQQASDPGFNPMTRQPVHRVRLTITGIGVFTDEVVQDDIDRIYRILATPALTRQELRCCAAYLWTGLRLARGDRDVAAGAAGVRQAASAGNPSESSGSRRWSKARASGRSGPSPSPPAVFGLIAALAALVLAMQAIRRKILGGRDASRRSAGGGCQPVRHHPGRFPRHHLARSPSERCWRWRWR